MYYFSTQFRDGILKIRLWGAIHFELLTFEYMAGGCRYPFSMRADQDVTW